MARWRKRNKLNQVSRRESENRVNLNRWSSGVVALQDLALSFVKDNNGDLLSENNGFFDEAFGHEWEIVREPGVDPAFERANPGDAFGS